MPRSGQGIKNKARGKLLKDLWFDKITHPKSEKGDIRIEGSTRINTLRDSYIYRINMQ